MTASSGQPTRRRVITLMAATAGCAIAGRPARASADYEWRGVAMGAEARILFNGIDGEAARSAAAMVEAEIDRLENALSLFRPDSELCRLNRDGLLRQPSADFIRALRLATDMAKASGGLFDPTVQRLWEAHIDWFTASPNAGLPPDERLAAARQAVDWRKVAIGADEIGIGQGQRLTLNGLGQGYVTDRIAELLAGRGFEHILVDLGEQRALGARQGGEAWQIARADAPPIPLLRGAVATSEGAGCVLGASGAAHHLFDPRSGRSAQQWKRVTVHHRAAAIADGLSTALSVASAAEIEMLLPQFPGTMVWARDRAGRDRRFLAGPVDGVQRYP